MESWQVLLNGQSAPSGFTLENVNPQSPLADPLSVGETASLPLKLDMDISTLAALGLAPVDDYSLNLIIDLEFSQGSEAAQGSVAAQTPLRIQVSALAEFPGVQEPVFTITAIAILRAELVNTRFRVGLRIDNPNPFPVELSAFSYALYGNGRLWADGIERNIIEVPAKSSVSGNLFLIMNFIDMSRALLDQIINLVSVNYRFAGEAQVGTGIDYLPSFRTEFNLSGYSEVLGD